MSLRRVSSAMGIDETRNASRGLNGCVGGSEKGTPAWWAFRYTSFRRYLRLAGTSAGPFVPCAPSSAPNTTGMGSMSRPHRAASAWIRCQPTYAYGDT